MSLSTHQVKPIRRIPDNLRIEIPGSKSISNRALLMAALGSREVKLHGLLESEDTELMIRALRSLGVVINDLGDRTYEVIGGTLFSPQEALIDVGTAGTVARLLIGVLGVTSGSQFRVDGTPAMRLRPMVQLMEALEELGCEVSYLGEKGFIPFEIKTHGVHKNSWNIDASASSQVVSALMIAASVMANLVEIHIKSEQFRKPYIMLTQRMLEQFGSPEVSWSEDGKICKVAEGSGNLQCPEEYSIEPDVSAASYFMTLPFVVGGKAEIVGLSKNSMQGDMAYLNILESLGARSSFGGEGLEIDFEGSKNSQFEYSFYPISDTFMTLAAVSPLLERPIKISGIGHTRKQESNRVSATATELKKLGQKVIESEDALEIDPSLEALKKVAQHGVAIDTYKDHRIAMSFGILGCLDLLENGDSWMTINNPDCSAKTFPKFFDVLDDIASS